MQFAFEVYVWCFRVSFSRCKEFIYFPGESTTWNERY